MKLNQIRDVIAVAERGSLRSAARYLRIAQPAITRSIRELENELGVMLFERYATGMQLTKMGEAFLVRAKAIQREIERTREEMSQLNGPGYGTVTIGLSAAAHLAILPRTIASFWKRFPNVRLHVREGLFPAVEGAIQNGEVDFYIGPLSEGNPPTELVIEPLFENRRIIVGRRGHPLARSRGLEDLVGAHWVTTSVTLASEAELQPVFAAKGLPQPEVIAQVETTLSMIVMVACSDLLALLPQQWRGLMAGSALVEEIGLTDKLLAPRICAVRRAKLPLTPAAEHLMDLCRKAAVNHERELAQEANE